MLDRIRQMYRENPTRTIAIGVGILVVTPTVIPLLKPVAKATLKTGLTLYEKTRSAVAETGEAMGDLLAEAKAEVAAETKQKAQQKAQIATNLIAPQESEN